MSADKAISSFRRAAFARYTGRLAIVGVILLLFTMFALGIVRNSVESNIVQRAASDLPLLKNRWPQFKKAVEALRAPIAASLANTAPLSIDAPLPQLMREITEAHSNPLAGSNAQGRISAHIEIVYFERDSVRP